MPGVVLKSSSKNYQPMLKFTDRQKKNSDKEYQHVVEIWHKFEMKLMKDYDDKYLKWGVLLLANVFEKIKNSSLKSYGLCQRYYLSAPALSCTSMHSMTKVEVEIISDAAMYLFFKIRCRKKVPKRVKRLCTS